MQDTTHRILALPQLGAIVAVPRTTLLENTKIGTQINYFALSGNSLSKDNFKLGGLEWRRNFVLYHLYARLITIDIIAIFELSFTANIKTH